MKDEFAAVTWILRNIFGQYFGVISDSNSDQNVYGSFSDESDLEGFTKPDMREWYRLRSRVEQQLWKLSWITQTNAYGKRCKTASILLFHCLKKIHIVIQ